MYVIKTESFAKRFKFTKVQLRGGQNAQSKMKIKIEFHTELKPVDLSGMR